MTREEKLQAIENIAATLESSEVIYLADISELNAEDSSKLRRACFNQGIKLEVVKNTLLAKAMEKVATKDFGELPTVLKGNTSMMIAEVGNVPGKLIKEFRKKNDKPVVKGAYVQESIYVGDDQLEALATLKSKEDLIGDVITLLQSPATTVLGQLQSGGNTVTGLLKALEERA